LQPVYQEIAFHIEFCLLDANMSLFSNLSIAFASILVVFQAKKNQMSYEKVQEILIKHLKGFKHSKIENVDQCK